MKNYLKITAILFGVFFIGSCSDKYENPLIKFENDSQSLIFDGSNEVDIKISFEANALIESVKLSKPTTSGTETIEITSMMGINYGISSKGLASAEYYLKVTNADLNNLKQSGKFPLSYSFTLTDQQGNEVNAVYTVSMPQTNSYLKIKTGFLYHQGSTLTNSWDLANDVAVAKTGAASAQSIYTNDLLKKKVQF
jgi:hypothetical protein